MPRKVRITTKEELSQIFLETLVNKTSKATKVSRNGVLQGISYGVASTAQKAIKDTALVESNIFPDFASGSQLDQIAENYGIAPRFNESRASTYVRLFAEPNTAYTAGTNNFQTTDGLVFELEQDITVGSTGVAYAKVRSVETGANTNVEPLAINQINPIPSGHQNVINEYEASGGRDEESDEAFRQRIKEGSNILAKNTISSLEQAFINVNPEILKIFYQGVNSVGQIVIAIATVNGVDLDQTELDELLDEAGDNLAISDLKSRQQSNYGVQLKNIEYQPIDISFRVQLLQNFNQDEVRKEIQTRLSKILDFRFVNTANNKIEWDSLLSVVKNTRGVKYVPDQFFFPNNDIPLDGNKLPRIRGFRMLNLNGGIISNEQGTLQSIYYPNKADFGFQQTVLN